MHVLVGLPILGLLRTKIQWHQAQQTLLAENVDNADMPGFRPRDLSELGARVSAGALESRAAAVVGGDGLALHIRALAAEHGVAVVKNPPLAHARHAPIEIDDEIPAKHYRAVAKVIGFVLRLTRRAA